MSNSSDRKFDRMFVIVLDSLGVGEAPDAADYGDAGANTLGHIMEAVPATRLPTMEKLGLGNIGVYQNLAKNPQAIGLFGKMAELSAAKDTTSGHWEMMGLIVEHGFQLYPKGFPADWLAEFEKAIGRKTVGNKPASGTDILVELGPHHEKTGDIIVYTSGDSVFQVAAHEQIVPIAELYKICEEARRRLVPPVSCARVIARPFEGTYPNYTRTSRRHDYSVKPHEKTLLDYMVTQGYRTYGIGKISDIFDGNGVQESTRTQDNLDGLEITLEHVKSVAPGSFVFTNLVDFDSKYGHRQDPVGYAKALEEFDGFLPRLLDALGPKDLLFITADHGCDPCDDSTDHTREYVPLLGYSPSLSHGVDLGIRATFNDLSRTIADLWSVSGVNRGQSFAEDILRVTS